MPGLRSKVFTVNFERREATHFYVGDQRTQPTRFSPIHFWSAERVSTENAPASSSCRLPRRWRTLERTKRGRDEPRPSDASVRSVSGLIAVSVR